MKINKNLYKVIKKNFILAFPFIAITCVLAGVAMDTKVGSFWWCMQYSVWTISMITFLILGNRKIKISKHQLEKNQFEFIEMMVNNRSALVMFFVPIKTEGKLRRLWYKIRGKQVLRKYVASYQDDSNVNSYITYVFTERDLFQAKLKGYYTTKDIQIARRAENDPWMIKRMRINN